MPRSLPRWRDSRAARREARDVGELERHVHVLGELAAVIGEGEPGLERHGVRRNGVAPAQLHRIEAQLIGREIDQPLDHIGGFGTAVAAIGPHRIGMGEHGRDVGMQGRRPVDARERADIGDEGLAADLQIGAEIGDGLHAHGQEIAVAVERELGIGDVVARLRVAQEGLRAGADPLDRPPGDLGGQQHQGDLVVDRRLHAEAAADVAGDDADLVLRNPQHELRQLLAERMRALQRRVDGVAAVGRMIDRRCSRAAPCWRR